MHFLLVILNLVFAQSAFAGGTELSPAAQEALNKAKACISATKDNHLNPAEICAELLKEEGVLPAILESMTVDPTECLNNAHKKNSDDMKDCRSERTPEERKECREQIQSNYNTNRHHCMNAQQNAPAPVNIEAPKVNLNINAGSRPTGSSSSSSSSAPGFSGGGGGGAPGFGGGGFFR